MFEGYLVDFIVDKVQFQEIFRFTFHQLLYIQTSRPIVAEV